MCMKINQPRRDCHVIQLQLVNAFSFHRSDFYDSSVINRNVSFFSIQTICRIYQNAIFQNQIKHEALLSTIVCQLLQKRRQTAIQSCSRLQKLY